MSDSSYRQIKKDVAYTITSGRWTKDDQARADVAWNKIQEPLRVQRRQNAVSVVHGGSPARELTETEKAELIHVQARRKPVERSQPSPMLPTPTLGYIDAPRPPKRLYDHFKTIVSSIWTNAFDSERK